MIKQPTARWCLKDQAGEMGQAGRAQVGERALSLCLGDRMRPSWVGCVLGATLFDVDLFCCKRLSSKGLDVDGQAGRAARRVQCWRSLAWP